VPKKSTNKIYGAKIKLTKASRDERIKKVKLRLKIIWNWNWNLIHELATNNIDSNVKAGVRGRHRSQEL